MEKYLDEERYQKNKSKIKVSGIIILIVLLSIGGLLIFKGVSGPSEEKIVELEEKLNIAKEEMITKRNQLEEQIKPVENEIYYLQTTLNDNIENKNKIQELEESIQEEKQIISDINYIINNNQMSCPNDNYNSYKYTKNYCEIKNKLNNLINKEYYPLYYIGGGLAIFLGIIIFIKNITIAKSRERMAFRTQSMMPIAKESLEDMAPTMRKVAKDTLKEMTPAYKDIAKEMAPIYSDIAKEVTKGIKKGLQDNENNDEKQK